MGRAHPFGSCRVARQRNRWLIPGDADFDYSHHLRCGLLGDCDRVVRASDQEAIVVKTHAPFLISTHAPYVMAAGAGAGASSDVGVGAFALLVSRNPLDNFNAWVRYEDARGDRSSHKHQTLEDFLDAWSRHHL